MKGKNFLMVLMFVMIISSLSVFGSGLIQDEITFKETKDVLTIEKQDVKIEYQEKINYLEDDINKAVTITNNENKNTFNIKIDSENYPNLNKSAKLIFKNTNFLTKPKIYKLKKEIKTITNTITNNKTAEIITEKKDVEIINKVFIGYPEFDKINNEYYFYVSSFSEYVLTDDLISYYKFDETSGTTAEDSHGDNDGTIYGVNINQEGKINKGYSFDGDIDYINTGISISQNFSISFWIDTDLNSVAHEGIFTFVTSSTGRNGLTFIDSGANTFALLGYNSNTFKGQLFTSEYNNGFNHIVITWDGLNAKLYLNGVLDESGVINDISVLENSLVLGRKYALSDESEYIGYLDEVGVWDRIINSDEVSTLYYSGNGLQYPFTESYINCSNLIYNVTEYIPSFNVNITCISDYNFTNYTLDSNFYNITSLNTNETIINSSISNPLNNTNYSLNVCNYYICEDFNISINWLIDDINPFCNPLPNKTDITRNENFTINVNCSDQYTNLTLDFYLKPETENKTIITNSSTYNENVILLAPAFDFTLYLNTSDSRGNYVLYSKMYNANAPSEATNETLKTNAGNYSTSESLIFLGLLFLSFMVFLIGIVLDIPIFPFLSGILTLFMGVLFISYYLLGGVIILIIGLMKLLIGFIKIKND